MANSSPFATSTGLYGTDPFIDEAAFTTKNFLGLDSIRVGRQVLDSFSLGLVGKAIGVDGVTVNTKVGDVLFTGAVNNINAPYPGGTLITPGGPITFAASTTKQILATGEFTYSPNTNSVFKVGYYNAPTQFSVPYAPSYYLLNNVVNLRAHKIPYCIAEEFFS